MTPSPDAATDGPTLLTRLAAKLRGEVPAEALEAFRNAGGAVYPMLLGSCETAAGNAALGRHPWSTRQDELLAVWAALVLQVVGEALLAEDYAAAPATAGYLPPVTAEQAWTCFDQVGPWLGRARQCQADPAYDLGGELALPGRFGGWVADDECPPAHLRALCGAAAVICMHLHTLLGALLSPAPRAGSGRSGSSWSAGWPRSGSGWTSSARSGRARTTRTRSWRSGCWTSPARCWTSCSCSAS